MFLPFRNSFAGIQGIRQGLFPDTSAWSAHTIRSINEYGEVLRSYKDAQAKDVVKSVNYSVDTRCMPSILPYGAPRATCIKDRAMGEIRLADRTRNLINYLNLAAISA
jgi:hypothetical protein